MSDNHLEKNRQNQENAKTKQNKINPKIKLLVVTFLLIIIGVFAVISIISERNNARTEEAKTSPSPTATTTSEPGISTEGDIDDEQSTTFPQETDPIFLQGATFPLVSKNVNDIEITSATNGFCGESTDWKLKFFIRHKKASEQNKYAFNLIPEDGVAFTLYEGDVDMNIYNNATHFFYLPEYGNTSPIIYDGISWSPTLEPVDATKIYVETINLETRVVESCFYITIHRDEAGYRITSLQSAEFNGDSKEKLYNIAIDYYKTKNDSIELQGIDHAVMSLSPKISNDMYFINDIPKDGSSLRSIIVAYLPYDADSVPFQLPQGCFVVYINKDDLSVIGEGKMFFDE